MPASRPAVLTAESPVFVVGCPRSGTTLVYSILLSSEEFPVYEAESSLLSCEVKYRSLRGEESFGRFVGDFVDSRQFRRSGLSKEEIEQAPPEARVSYSSFLAYFMNAIAAKQGKTRWVEKTPNHLGHIQTLSVDFPTARFVHVIRDGRDVALSKRRLNMDRVPSDDPLVRLVWSARIWESLVAEGQRQGAAVGDRYLEIKYEDVVREPDRTLSELSEFARVDLSVAGVRDSTVAALGRGNTAYGEKMEGIAKQGLDRWRTELDADEREAMEWAIGHKLQELGYLDSQNDRSGSGISLNYRLHSALAPFAFRGRRWLTRNTPIGRATSGPLEIGLD